MSKVLQLPIDIICSFFDQLRDDAQSLATCSLVCRTWEPASRSVLFRSLSINEFKVSYAAFDNFLSAAAHIADHIVDLRLVGRLGLELFGSSSSAVYCSTLDVSLLARIVAKLPALRRLHLINLAYEEILGPLPRPRQTQAGLPSLDSLVFQNVPPISHEDSTLPELLSVIALFSSIGHLALIGDNSEVDHAADPNEMDDYEIPAQVEIRSLELEHLSSQVLAAVTRAIDQTAPFNRSLEALAVSIHDTYGCVAIIGDFLRRFRHSIKHFRFDPMVLAIRSDIEYDEWDQLYLSECSNLMTLTLALKLPSVMPRAYDAWERCFRAYKHMLSSPLPSSLEQVKLHLGATKPRSSISSLNWDEIDAVLCQISSLKSFVIVLGYPPLSSVMLADGNTNVDRFARLARGVRDRGILELRSGE